MSRAEISSGTPDGEFAKDVPSSAKLNHKPQKNYKGFVAGVFSGIAKLTVGHPFDTIKVRLQTSPKSQFRGPLDCLVQTVQKEGINGIYKGATPPLLGWMFMDSIMLGSLTFYRGQLLEHVFSKHPVASSSPSIGIPANNAWIERQRQLPTIGHAIAGLMAGSTVSFVATPVEHIKARLQTQYAAEKGNRLYKGPIDCLNKIFRTHGIAGVWHGLSATLVFRSFFLCWWGSYDLFTRYLQDHTKLSAPSINFWAGGLSAQVFWLTSYPADVLKQRIMTDPLGGALKDGVRRYPRWKDAARDVWIKDGMKGYWRGFLPCILRAFPANAIALVAFEGVMRALPD